MGNSKANSKTKEDKCFYKFGENVNDAVNDANHPKENNGCCSYSACLEKRCYYCLADDSRPRWRMTCEDTHDRNEPCSKMCFGYRKPCNNLKQ